MIRARVSSGLVWTWTFIGGVGLLAEMKTDDFCKSSVFICQGRYADDRRGAFRWNNTSRACQVAEQCALKAAQQDPEAGASRRCSRIPFPFSLEPGHRWACAVAPAHLGKLRGLRDRQRRLFAGGRLGFGLFGLG